MLLAIDIGNTNISFGLFKGKKLIKSWKSPTYMCASGLIKKIPQKDKICLVIICSVVPEVTKRLPLALKKKFNAKILVVGKDILVPIKNLYRKPKQVGQDRLVNAYAGLKLYGSGLIIIDFGTAITFDIVSKKGEYLGGLIFPGVELCLKSLYEKTALLPNVSLKTTKEIVGRDTINSINSGVFYGIAGMCESLIQKLQKKFKGYKVITTGGNAQTMKLFSKKLANHHPNLTLQGIQLLLKYIS